MDLRPSRRAFLQGAAAVTVAPPQAFGAGALKVVSGFGGNYLLTALGPEVMPFLGFELCDVGSFCVNEAIKPNDLNALLNGRSLFT